MVIKMKYKLCVIVCYFGRFPSYFHLWLKSCASNPTVDFKIYSDVQYEGTLPDNVAIVKTSLKAIKERTEQIVGFDVCLSRPYKLCDYRPLFGEIFKKDLAKYDFWGYCDLDIIIGDIRKFLTDDILDKYDKINRWGHLSFHRNTDECNNRYKFESVRYNYRDVLTRTRDFGFDEYDYTFIHQKHNFPILILPNSWFVDIRARHRRFCKQGEDNYNRQSFYWENGAVYRIYEKKGVLRTDEFIYIHFKKRGNLEVHFNAKDTDAFFITNSGFYKKDKKVDNLIIEQMNPYPGRIYEKYEDIKYKANSMVHRFRRKYFE